MSFDNNNNNNDNNHNYYKAFKSESKHSNQGAKGSAARKEQRQASQNKNQQQMENGVLIAQNAAAFQNAIFEQNHNVADQNRNSSVAVYRNAAVQNRNAPLANQNDAAPNPNPANQQNAAANDDPEYEVLILDQGVDLETYWVFFRVEYPNFEYPENTSPIDIASDKRRLFSHLLPGAALEMRYFELRRALADAEIRNGHKPLLFLQYDDVYLSRQIKSEQIRLSRQLQGAHTELLTASANAYRNGQLEVVEVQAIIKCKSLLSGELRAAANNCSSDAKKPDYKVIFRWSNLAIYMIYINLNGTKTVSAHQRTVELAILRFLQATYNSNNSVAVRGENVENERPRKAAWKSLSAALQEITAVALASANGRDFFDRHQAVNRSRSGLLLPSASHQAQPEPTAGWQLAGDLTTRQQNVFLPPGANHLFHLFYDGEEDLRLNLIFKPWFSCFNCGSSFFAADLQMTNHLLLNPHHICTMVPTPDLDEEIKTVKELLKSRAINQAFAVTETAEDSEAVSVDNVERNAFFNGESEIFSAVSSNSVSPGGGNSLQPAKANVSSSIWQNHQLPLAATPAAAQPFSNMLQSHHSSLLHLSVVATAAAAVEKRFSSSQVQPMDHSGSTTANDDEQNRHYDHCYSLISSINMPSKESHETTETESTVELMDVDVNPSRVEHDSVITGLCIEQSLQNSSLNSAQEPPFLLTSKKQPECSNRTRFASQPAAQQNQNQLQQLLQNRCQEEVAAVEGLLKLLNFR